MARARRASPPPVVPPVPFPRASRPLGLGPWPLTVTILVTVVLGVAAVFATGGFPALGTFGPGAPSAVRPDAADAPAAVATVVPGTEWSVRSGPSTSATVVGQVAPGDEVVVTCTSGGWAAGGPRAGRLRLRGGGCGRAGTPPSC